MLAFTTVMYAKLMPKILLIFLEGGFNDYLSSFFNPSYTVLIYIIIFYCCIHVNVLYFHRMINILCIIMSCRKTFRHRKRQERNKRLTSNEKTSCTLDKRVDKSFLYTYVSQIPLNIDYTNKGSSMFTLDLLN